MIISRNTNSAGRPIVVLGGDRSSTSLAAQVVHRWGGDGGDLRHLMEHDPRNPRGCWESQSLSDSVHDEIPGMLKDLGGDVTYVITVRNPYDSAVSWHRDPQLENHRDAAGGIDIVVINLLRWQYRMLAILRHTSGSRRRIFLRYEDLIEDPVQMCGSLCGFLDRQADRDSRGDGKVEYMAQAVAANRNRSQIAFSEVEEATQAQKSLYRLLLRLARDPSEPFRPEDYPMLPGWQEYLNNDLLFRVFYRRATKEMNSPLVRPAVAVYRVLNRFWKRLIPE